MKGWVKSLFSWRQPSGLAHAALLFLKKISSLHGTRFAYILVTGAIVSGIATYVALTSTGFLSSSPKLILVLINLDLILLLLLALVVVQKVIEIWVARRRGLAGSRLHVRLVMLFSLLAITPAIIVAVFSVLFFNFGLQAWFSERVEMALNNSVAVAEAYQKEHRKLIRSDVVSIGRELMADFPMLLTNTEYGNQKLTLLTRLRSVPEAIVFDTRHQILARSNLTFTLEFEMVPQWAVDRALAGDVVVIANETGDRVRALMLLDRAHEIFLYIGRFVDPVVINHRQQTLQAVTEYNVLKGKHSQIEIRFALVFILVALLLLLVAIWIGLTFATQLSRPIRRLVIASEKIRQGDLGVRVEEDKTEEELMSLSRAFNRMASQLEAQRRDLVEANHLLDLRRQFTESVLGGVTAGVIGLDAKGEIYLPNQSASKLLDVDLNQYIGQKLDEISPEMGAWFSESKELDKSPYEGQIVMSRSGHSKTFLVRLVVERDGETIQGYVVTFDDMTELLSAQRKAAWSDVARRIAHEIKNPLTPIQLSAERLQRKYLGQIKEEPETFKICVETIVRQVEDIGRMVDEFSAFARMPVPIMEKENLIELCKLAIVLQRNAHPAIQFDFKAPDEDVFVLCDRRLVSQALTNLLQNAIDSVYSELSGSSSKRQGHVQVTLIRSEGVKIIVSDNGKGLPGDMMDRLTEPYITTKTKGTGLGLAIVKKIMEDHNGAIKLYNNPEGGARVELEFLSLTSSS